MKKKELYEAPSVETYELVPERVIADSQTYGGKGKPGDDLQQGNEYFL